MIWDLLRQSDATGAVPVAEPAPRLAYDLLDSYVSWREASEAVERAYEHWRSGQQPDQGLAFAAYLAALDQEERAAFTFRKRGERC